MFWLNLTGLLLFSYLLGGIPSGLLLSRLKKIELRRLGSGNVGATNVYRAMGLGWAVLVFILDALKGAGAVLVGRYFLGEEIYPGVCGLASVFGHIFSPYLRFRGGKGVACGFGAMLVLAPLPSLISFGIWAVLVGLTRVVSLASLVATLSLLALVWIFTGELWLLLVGSGVCLLIFWAHRENLARILRGKEPKIQRIKDSPPKDSE